MKDAIDLLRSINTNLLYSWNKDLSMSCHRKRIHITLNVMGSSGNTIFLEVEQGTI